MYMVSHDIVLTVEYIHARTHTHIVCFDFVLSFDAHMVLYVIVLSVERLC